MAFGQGEQHDGEKIGAQALPCVDIKGNGHIYPVEIVGFNTFTMVDSVLRDGVYTFRTQDHTLDVPRDEVRLYSGGNAYNAYVDYIRMLLAGEVSISSSIFIQPQTGATIIEEVGDLRSNLGERLKVILGPHEHPRRMFHGKGTKQHKPATFHFSSGYDHASELDELASAHIPGDHFLIADKLNQIVHNRTLVVPSNRFFPEILETHVGTDSQYARLENVVLAFNDDEAVEKMGVPRESIPNGIPAMTDARASAVLSRFCRPYIPEAQQKSQSVQLLFSFETRDEGSYAVYDTPKGRKIVYLPLDFDRSTEIGNMFRDDSVVRPEWAGEQGAGRGDARAIAKEMAHVFYNLHGENLELALKSALLCAEAASSGMHHSLHSNYARHDLEDLRRVLIDMPLQEASRDTRIRIFDFDENA